MAIIIRTLCWALIFIIRLRFPPGSSLACNYTNHINLLNYYMNLVCRRINPNYRHIKLHTVFSIWLTMKIVSYCNLPSKRTNKVHGYTSYNCVCIYSVTPQRRDSTERKHAANCVTPIYSVY